MKSESKEKVQEPDTEIAAEENKTELDDQASTVEELSGDEPAEAVDILSDKDKEIAQLKDLMMRRQADFENYKKRCVTQEERNKQILIRELAIDIIGINDNLIHASEHALEITSGEQLEDAHKSYVEGVMMISKSIETMLAKHEIEEIDAADKPFDPNFHEAVDIAMGENVTEDTVTKVYQKGFKFDEFVIRSAKVQVTKPLPVQKESGSDTSSDEEK